MLFLVHPTSMSGLPAVWQVRADGPGAYRNLTGSLLKEPLVVTQRPVVVQLHILISLALSPQGGAGRAALLTCVRASVHTHILVHTQ